MSIAEQTDLNPEQRRAVATVDGPLLIVAGAGSGKTRVITARIAHMLERGIPQSRILALTFTNKAAREMQHRVRELTGKRLTQLTVSTFHAFGVTVLRENAARLGYRDNFSIYDTVDQQSLLKETAREIKFSLEGEDVRSILGMFSALRTGRREWDSFSEPYRPLFDEYRRHMRVYNAVDFDDLILLPVELLSTDQEVRDRYRARFRYFLVDEFQDTSHVQYRFMRLLADGSRNVCVVGDDDQSIYSWRGANAENLFQFDRDFPERTEIKLERNYRSTNTILEAANGVIRHNASRKDKQLWSGDDRGKPIYLHYPEDERQEAGYIAETIQSLAMRERIQYHQVAVLIRTNALSRAIEEAFLGSKIPYRMSGGTSFFQRKEIKDIISYMRLIANHDDDVSLLRILNTPRRGIGRKTVEALNEIADRKACSLFSAIEPAVRAADSPVSERARPDLERFLELIHTYRTSLLSKGGGLAEGLRGLVEEIDYWSHLVSEHPTNDKAARWKHRNIDLFISGIESWERDPDNSDPTLFRYLNRISLQTRDDDDDADGQGKVNLMTIHAAKGLERDVVFVAGCENGIIPHRRALDEAEENIEEERRLFYVALTRARAHLYLTSARERTIMRERVQCEPSPFLEEIPQHLVEPIERETPVETAEAADYFAAIKARIAGRG